MPSMGLKKHGDRPHDAFRKEYTKQDKRVVGCKGEHGPTDKTCS